MIYAEGMQGRFRLGYGAQFIHVAAAIAEDRAEIDRLVAESPDPNARDAGGCRARRCWYSSIAMCIRCLQAGRRNPLHARSA